MNKFSRGMRLAAAIGVTTAIAVMPAVRAYAASSPAPVPVVEVTPIAGGDTTGTGAADPTASAASDPSMTSDPSMAMDDTAAGVTDASSDIGAAVSDLGGGSDPTAADPVAADTTVQAADGTSPCTCQTAATDTTTMASGSAATTDPSEGPQLYVTEADGVVHIVGNQFAGVANVDIQATFGAVNVPLHSQVPSSADVLPDSFLITTPVPDGFTGTATVVVTAGGHQYTKSVDIGTAADGTVATDDSSATADTTGDMTEDTTAMTDDSVDGTQVADTSTDTTADDSGLGGTAQDSIVQLQAMIIKILVSIMQLFLGLLGGGGSAASGV